MNSRELTPNLSLSQNSSIFDFFDADCGPDFWGQAMECTQMVDVVDTASRSCCSSSNTVPTGSAGSSDTLITSSSSSTETLANNTLKRKISLVPASTETTPRPFKTARTSTTVTSTDRENILDSDIINLSPPQHFQACIESRKLPWSVQWELARLVSKGVGGWETITLQQLDELRPVQNSTSPNFEAARKIPIVFCKGTAETDAMDRLLNDEKKATDPWGEFDQEEKFITNNPGSIIVDWTASLGEPRKVWYGGRIHFLASLKKPHKGEFKIELMQAELSTSNSFARRFGSKSFLRLKIPKSVLNNGGRELQDFLLRPVILCNCVFRAFYGKEQTVFYFRTNEVWNAKPPVKSLGSPLPSSGMSLEEFIEWHNPQELNNGQAVAKWSSRFALGLSTSIPGLTLQEKDITVIDDKVNSSGSDMTDGAGFISRNLLQQLKQIHGWDIPPSAIQVRVMGSKGLLVEHPDPRSVGIQLRRSQIKIKYQKPLDATHLTIDILRTSHARCPIRISPDVIINLSENNVKSGIFKQLLSHNLNELIDPLLNWDENDPDAMPKLWQRFERIGSVFRSRRAREEIAVARVKGYTELDTEEVDEDEDDYEDTARGSSAWWPDAYSGSPSCLEETVMSWLDSGFHPTTCAILRQKAQIVIKNQIQRLTKNIFIDIPQSCGGWIVPDPFNVLKEGEVFFQSSQVNLISQDGTATNLITGDVLITRDPCRLPTDVQKWKAVDHVMLHYLKDVIVLSTQGSRRAADWLSGGDYDGDKAKLIWQRELLEDFRPAPPNYADPPEDLNSYFREENERVCEFISRTEHLDNKQRLYELQKSLLGAIQDHNMVGLYSGFCDCSAYENGYQNKTTKLLAYMFTTILDGRKTGKSVKPEIFQQHRAKFGRPVGWKLKVKQIDTSISNDNIPKVKRKGKKHVMDELLAYAGTVGDEKLATVEKQVNSCVNQADAHLLAPYERIRKRIEEWRSMNLWQADVLERELKLVETHVEKVYQRHRAEIGPSFTKLPIEKRQDILRSISKSFNQSPAETEFLLLSLSELTLDWVKASYAYHYDSKRAPQGYSSFSRFPWDVTFRTLCDIKTHALHKEGKEFKPLMKEFYNLMAVKVRKP